MTQIGKIIIRDDGVYFEPDGLFAKPSWNPTESDPFNSLSHLKWEEYKLELQDYEASKQLIEVDNVKHEVEKVFVPAMSEAFINKYYINGQRVKDNQPCKAEIKNNKAKILKLL